MKKMNEKRRLREKVQGRIRGFVALMLAMVVAVGFIPMQSVKAGDGFKGYFLLCEDANSNDTQYLGSGILTADGLRSLYYSNVESIAKYKYANKSWENGDKAKSDGNNVDVLASIGIGASVIIGNGEDRVNIRFGSYYDSDSIKFTGAKEVGPSRDGEFGLGVGKYRITYVSNTPVGESGNQFTFNIAEAIAAIKLSEQTLELKVGDSAKTLTVTPSEAKVNWTSSDTAVAKVSDSGEVTAVGAGTTVIKATLVDDETVSAECTVTVKASGEDKKDSADSSDYKKDDVLKDEKGNDTGYVVANPSKTNFQAQYKGTAQDKNASKVVIQDEIKDANGNVFKVTMISDGALENAQGKELVIGKNVKKIGNRALKGAKFKKITFRTNKKGRIQIGRNAFRVKSKKCTVKVKGAKGRYQKLLKNKILKQSSKGVSVKF